MSGPIRLDGGIARAMKHLTIYGFMVLSQVNEAYYTYYYIL